MIHCLVIDDSKLIRRIHSRMLEQLDLQVSQAENGAEALDLCAAGMPDLVLVDWNMPVMDGFTFLTRLRATPGGMAPKVVLCTIESDLEHIKRALNEGADEYIMKPFDVEILAAKLAAIGIPIPSRPFSADPLAEGR
ncbi:Chemotaxis regulator - transmits chemoreceptor signals to flagelllar motor components CheY [Paramagnetospirillum magnetotacticum MS-1]|uniref:Chemotaxis regulator-transmits chemoreceptor signals to flagelllar motor components CheY n=1 Tax=Paramagnetospirillum magnetotacticum MS-1 TaxID=272627 RepID=A0A0C2YUB4_PARME|nr:response regulator [Paramagnetospirillum magnetotacticum]KIL98295.1 Chemotaxis regulator - transmits chemoreceptor signals to flagelllar motor components CheY [Paramagnetospirillum magnetotacticum MS-1]